MDDFRTKKELRIHQNPYKITKPNLRKKFDEVIAQMTSCLNLDLDNQSLKDRVSS